MLELYKKKKGNPRRVALRRLLMGAAMTELLVVMLGLMPLSLGTLQGAFIYNAKNIINYATYEAARSGAVNNARRSAIEQELARQLTPLYGGGRDSRSLGKAYIKARLDLSLPAVPGADTGSGTRIEIISPSREAFEDFGEEIDGVLQIPNDHLRYRSRDIGPTSGVNIQDANLLKIKVTYGYKLTIPIVNRLIGTTLALFDPANANYYKADPPRLPIVSTATVRMQSNAYPDGNLSEPPTGGGGAAVVGGHPGGVQTPGPGQDAEQADEEADPACADGRCGDDADQPSTPTDPNAGGNSSSLVPDGGTGSGAESPEPLECEQTAVEDDNNGAEGNDEATWGSELWNNIKQSVTGGYQFVKGFWEGLKGQLSDLKDLVLHPVDTAKGLARLAQAFYDDPTGTAKMIGEALGQDWTKLTQCGAFDRGKVIGSYVSPAFMLKLVSKLAKFEKLADAIPATKKDFGCASFVAGTPVWTANGKVPIENIKVGDRVLSRSASSYRDSAQKILKTFGRTAPYFYRLSTEYGSIEVTAEHPFWKQGAGWTEAQDLRVDDIVASGQGDVLILGNSRVDKPIEVHNLAVDNTPSYFVGAGALWVHNSKCDLSFPKGLSEGIDLEDLPLKGIDSPAAKGALGEGKVNKFFDNMKFESLGTTNLDPKVLTDPKKWHKTIYGYRGSKGIDSIYRDPDSKIIYIIESKASGVKEGCKTGSLCPTEDGMQMSRDWINEKRLEAAGLDEADRERILQGLEKNDGTVVRLYAGTNAQGKTRFYEIKDHPSGDPKRVVVDRAGNEYQF